MSDDNQRIDKAEIAQLREQVDLVALIGSRVALKRDGREYKGLCPFHDENTPSFHVIPHKHFYHCFGCGADGDAIKWLTTVEKLSFRDAVARLRGGHYQPRCVATPEASAATIKREADDLRGRIDKAREIWAQTVTAPGTLVDVYMASRGLGSVVLPTALRFHPRLWNSETAQLLPAMVAGVVDDGGAIIGIHRTYLRPDGKGKAALEKPKMMLGNCAGHHIRLDPLQPGQRLAIAEGIETALTIRMARPDLRVWAAMSLTNMRAPVRLDVAELILCADADNKDQTKADEILLAAARSHCREGRRVRIAWPEAGKDFNDMVRAE